MRFNVLWRRRVASELYIKVALLMPPGLAPVINKLREIERLRIEKAKKQVSRLAELEKPITHCGFSMIELFPIELYENVITATISFFPEFVPGFSITDFSNLEYYSTLGLGIIRRKAQQGISFYEKNVRILPSLPEWVEQIELTLSKVHDSSFIIIANVITSPEVDKLFSAKANKIVKPPVEMSQLRWSGPASLTNYSASIVFQEGYQDLIASFHSKICKLVFRSIYPFGYFVSHKLMPPTIEILHFRSDETLGEAWIEQADRYLNAIGTNLTKDYLYGEGVAIGIPLTPSRSGGLTWTYVFNQQYVAPGYSSTSSTEPRYVIRRIQDRIRGVAHAIVDIGYQGALQKQIFEFRRKAFVSSSKRFSIIKQAALYERIRKEWILFNRIKRESVSIPPELHGAENEILVRLQYRTAFMPKAQSTETADILLHEQSVSGFNQVADTFDDIRSGLSDTIANQNIRIIFYLTIITIVLTAIPIVWPVVSNAFSTSERYIEKLFLYNREKARKSLGDRGGKVKETQPVRVILSTLGRHHITGDRRR